jgi:hypothetical protein
MIDRVATRHIRPVALAALGAALVLPAAGCRGDGGPPATSAPDVPAPFASPEEVIIEGYDGHAMEPFLARDGSILFFNNLNADSDAGKPNDTNIHFARHVSSGLRFQYVGTIAGASTDLDPAANELEAVPSLDREQRLFFTRTIGYGPTQLATLFQGRFADGALSDLAPVGPLKNGSAPAKLGDVNMDAEVSADGATLYFTEAVFAGGGLPESADLGMAARQPDGSFAVLPDSQTRVAAINTAALEYAPCTATDDNELYFTRLPRAGPDAGTPSILVSRRANASSPWGEPARIAAITGELVEAPSISADGRALYYHARVGGRFRIFRVTR